MVTTPCNTNYFKDSSWRRAAPEIPERRDIPPVRSERPKLQLEKRTVPKTGTKTNEEISGYNEILTIKKVVYKI